jgi:hypothetical protein
MGTICIPSLSYMEYSVRSSSANRAIPSPGDAMPQLVRRFSLVTDKLTVYQAGRIRDSGPNLHDQEGSAQLRSRKCRRLSKDISTPIIKRGTSDCGTLHTPVSARVLLTHDSVQLADFGTSSRPSCADDAHGLLYPPAKLRILPHSQDPMLWRRRLHGLPGTQSALRLWPRSPQGPAQTGDKGWRTSP